MSHINSKILTSSLTNDTVYKIDVNATPENKGKIFLLGMFSLNFISLNNSYLFSASSDISSSNGFNEDTLFSALKELFWKISSQKKRTGVMAPNGFIAKLKKENGKFLFSLQCMSLFN